MATVPENFTDLKNIDTANGYYTLTMGVPAILAGDYENITRVALSGNPIYYFKGNMITQPDIEVVIAVVYEIV